MPEAFKGSVYTARHGWVTSTASGNMYSPSAARGLLNVIIENALSAENESDVAIDLQGAEQLIRAIRTAEAA